jgi:hypothetical protein
MAKPATELQISLAVDAWRLSERRAWLLRQLAELDELHRQAIALAATYGVPQKTLAALCEVSGPRISQIVSSTDLPPGSPDAFHDTVTELLERRPSTPIHGAPADKAAWDRKFALSRGIEPAQ